MENLGELLGQMLDDSEGVLLSEPPLQRATRYSAGYDLPSAINVTIPPHCVARIETGIRLRIPQGYYMKIYGRSSLAMRNASHSPEIGTSVSYSPIVECGGVIDSDYTGTISVLLHNVGIESFEVKVGDRIAQGVLHKYYTFDNETIKMDEGFKHEGFGSTN